MYTDLVNVFILYFILIYINYRGLVLYIFKTVLNIFLIDFYDLYNLHTKVY